MSSAAKRANGEGTKPRRRSDGLWYSHLRVTYPDGTKGRESFYGRSSKIVDEKKRARVRELEAGGVRPTFTTVAEFLDQWLTDVAKPTTKPKTYRSYESIVRNHLVPAFGMVELRKLTPAMIQHGVAGDAKDPAGARTRELAFVVLRAALAVATRWGLIPRNPAALVDKPRVPAREMLFYSPSEVTRLLAARGDDRIGALYSLAAFSGMREGELFGLQWSDVRLDDLAIDVRHQLSAESLELVDLKTRMSRRTVDISPVLAAELRAHRARMLAEGNPHGFVFCDTTGGPLRASNVTRRSWQPLKKRAFGTKRPDGTVVVEPRLNVRFHDLRHTAATLMLAAGVHVLVVSRRLGHADVATTLRTYGHLLPLLQNNVTDAVEVFIARSGATRAAQDLTSGATP